MSFDNLEKTQLENVLFNIELLRNTITERLNMLNDVHYDESIMLNPNIKRKPLMVHSYPFFQFSYDGILPSYKDHTKYKESVRNFYFQETLTTYDLNEIDAEFNKAFLIFVHYFKNKMTRDLDNRNKKYIQDAIKRTGLIPDDSWHYVWNMDIAFHDDEKDQIQVYVIERQHLYDFLLYLEQHHEELKKEPFIKSRKEFVVQDHSRIEKEETERQERIKKTFEKLDVPGFWE